MTPDTHTIQELRISVGDGHELYIHEWGNSSVEIPILVLHGGPGGSCKDRHKANFDPERQRVIFFDQRGCGQSTPYGSLEHNTTDHLVSDISKIADRLHVKTFILTGTSWGSTLSLTYALRHPERVAGLVIGGVFTGTKAEIDWQDTGQIKLFYPDVWQRYLESTPEEHRENPSAYHQDKALHGSLDEQKASGYAFELLEGSLAFFDDRMPTPVPFDEYDPAGIRVEIHYLIHGCFLPEQFILKNAHALTMPVYIVQGRYDMVCPPVTAYKLHTAAPHSELYWTLGGHVPDHEFWNMYRSLLLRMTKETT